MSFKETATIAFSSALAGSSFCKKQDALADLLTYIETNGEIGVCDVDGEEVLETIYALFVSFVEKNQFAKHYRLAITIRDLSLEDTQNISALGFDVYSADGLRLAG